MENAVRNVNRRIRHIILHELVPSSKVREIIDQLAILCLKVIITGARLVTKYFVPPLLDTVYKFVICKLQCKVSIQAHINMRILRDYICFAVIHFRTGTASKFLDYVQNCTNWFLQIWQIYQNVISIERYSFIKCTRWDTSD